MKHRKLNTTEEISKRMSNVKLKKGVAEITLAKALWHKGFRYRYNYKNLPGSPDIVISKYHIAVFVDGEFWHGKDWDIKKHKLKSNRDFWIEKINENIQRDKHVNQLLEDSGWIVIRFWGKDVLSNLDSCVNRIVSLI